MNHPAELAIHQYLQNAISGKRKAIMGMFAPVREFCGETVSPDDLVAAFRRLGIVLSLESVTRVINHLRDANGGLLKSAVDSRQAQFPNVPRYMIEMALDYDNLGGPQHHIEPALNLVNFVATEAEDVTFHAVPSHCHVVIPSVNVSFNSGFAGKFNLAI